MLKNHLLLMVLVSFVWGGLTGCTSITGNSSSSQNSQKTSENNLKITTEIKIAGSSSTYSLLKSVIKSYADKHPEIKITLLPASNSESAIAAVKDGILQVAAVSKQLTAKDIPNTLEYREFAKDALLVATHPTVKGVVNLTTDNLKAIYSGKAKNWQEFGGPDAKIVVLDRPEDESAKKLLRKYYLGKDLPNGKDTVILNQEPDLITALQSTPYSIGAFALSQAISNNLQVNRLSLDGVEPSQNNIASGKYQMVRHIGVVTQKSLSPSVQKFLDFAVSDSMRSELTKMGLVLPEGKK
ncbi:substrate-binding domain-containing protein [Calothrix sp. 336/3]|uniref:substrate-binding domain-containing protein n=1 Tax=Calothrix sp. 336/3 TaxID=1337936 RepID=UPI0011875C95|nr:substrate-binding domain-containing protein [Calothrix sp. 336/3]